MSICTLYVRNLNERLSHQKLRSALEQLFSELGVSILEIRLFKNLQLRGQAFITLKSHEDCVRAIEQLNTKVLFDKPMDMYIAKANSDLATRERMDQSAYEQYLQEQRAQRREKRTKKRKSTLQTPATVKKRRIPGAKAAEPHKILLISNVPSSATRDQLESVFEKFTGFLNVNIVHIRNLALVEFRSDLEAARCLESLGTSIKINDTDCYVQFAKK
ncbi:hypothetical protein KL933_004649 [Ogataea haglerorum]|uniref:RRM domain-containing protein n=1 Tax=Ogataea haglerorum TaxID=1937702 RepID=A0AAN6HYS8_9ASCO|nr:hypothetical protein KL933_004649 [Ogataea haglerorum]